MSGVCLLGGGAAWGAGSLGPVAREVGAHFGVSLGLVGLLGGSFFFVGLVAAKLFVAPLIASDGAGSALRLSCVTSAGGNALCGATPWLAGLAAGRLVAGIGLGLAFVVGPALARSLGGPRLVGIFGGSITMGIAFALGVGGGLHDAGVVWRVGFFISALPPIAALALLPRDPKIKVGHGDTREVLRAAYRRASAWRLELLFATALGVPLVLGTWLVPVLAAEPGISISAAGILGFLLYAVATGLRPEGGRLDARGRPKSLLTGAALLLAAAGLVLIGVADSFPVALVGVALAGIGFALPYAAMYEELETLFPGAAIAAISTFSLGGNLLPLVLMPLVGAALDSGNGEEAMLGLAILPLLAGLANLRPVTAREPDQGTGLS